MSSREVFFLLSHEGEVLYRDEGTSATYIPDSRARWEAIWRERERLAEIAPSHPQGPLAFSCEDETTMEAITSAHGRSVVFSVVTAEGAVRREVTPGAGVRTKTRFLSAAGHLPMLPRETGRTGSGMMSSSGGLPDQSGAHEQHGGLVHDNEDEHERARCFHLQSR